MERIDDTTLFTLDDRRLIVKCIPDYTLSVISFFIFVILASFQGLLAIIPFLIFIFSILHHTKTCFDIEKKQVYSAQYLYKIELNKTPIIGFDVIDKILAKGSLSDPE